jgi:murein DD-endopeptidase MepM/ murein hydrolase activator NlpD
MKTISLILSIIILSTLNLNKDKYSKPFRKDDYIKIHRNYGWPSKFSIFCEPKKYIGIVIELKNNAPILSIQEGKVVELCDTCLKSKYGNYITIEHKAKTTAKYYHLSNIKVKKNQYIEKNEIIGISGNTGLTTVNCLGIEIKKRGKIVDPSKILGLK